MDDRRRLIEQGVNIERSRDESIKQSAADALSDRSNRGHSRDDALSDREFERLVDASYQIDDADIALEARATLYLCGRLGLRAGEAAHVHEDWVDWAGRTIDIPEFDSCEKGKFDGEVCGNCRLRAMDNLQTNNLTEQEAIDAIYHVLDDAVVAQLSDAEIFERSVALRDEVNMTYQEAVGQRWQPKTPQSARKVPFDFSARIELCLERFFDRFGGWMKSKCTMNRRLDRLVEIAELEGDVYLHCLRATAASAHASRDISVFALMSVMGWVDPATARTYVQSNAKRANREIRSKHR